MNLLWLNLEIDIGMFIQVNDEFYGIKNYVT